MEKEKGEGRQAKCAVDRNFSLCLGEVIVDDHICRHAKWFPRVGQGDDGGEAHAKEG
jgi:hypothetical protein